MPGNVYHNERRARRLRAVYRDQCRDNGTPCMHCHQPIHWTAHFQDDMAFTVEHLTPRSKGGARDDPANWGCAHRICNSTRRDTPLTPEVPPDPHSEEWPT